MKGDPDKQSIILNGHIDTVSPEPVEQWQHDPAGGEVEDGRLYGRGALDMKAGLIANLFTIKALQAAGIDPGGSVVLQSAIEEEDVGGGGTLACLMKGFTADAMIVTEPAPWVTVALAGILRCIIKVRGKSASPAQSHKGVNAISKMIPIYNAVEALDLKRKAEVKFPLFKDFEGKGPACHLIVGTFRAGEYIAMVPGSAEIGCRVGFIPGEERSAIRDLIETTVKEAAEKDPWLRDNPPEVRWLPFQADPFYQDPEHPFVKTVIEAAQAVAGPGRGRQTKRRDLVGRHTPGQSLRVPGPEFRPDRRTRTRRRRIRGLGFPGTHRKGADPGRRELEFGEEGG